MEFNQNETESPRSTDPGDTTNARMEGAGFTVTVVVAVATFPNASVTFAMRPKVPATFGVHVIIDASEVEQPIGRPR